MRNPSTAASVGFAVIDVETTGFNAAGTDRVIEVAAVLLGPDHTLQDQWSTLLNPGRDVGPTHVHRITAREVRAAPTFSQVAGDLAGRLAGRVVVAHNASFDIRFLLAEYGRIGVRTPLSYDVSICTMAAARTFLPGSKRTLAACCQAAGVIQTGAHDALADAHAAAGLLGYYYTQSAGQPFWHQMLAAAATQPWPSVAALKTPVVRRADVRERT